MTKILSILVILATASVANAQNDLDNREKFQFGLKIGGSYSNVYDSKGEAFHADPKVGFTGGAFLIFPIGKYLGIQPEAMITQKGFKGNGNLLGSSYSFKRTTTFFEVPILFAFKPSEFLTMLFGPQFSYLLNQKDKFTSPIVNTNQEREFEQDNIRKNILGIVAGVDINLKQIVMSGRIGWDVQNNKGDGTSSTPRYKNVCSQITVGYKFF